MSNRLDQAREKELTPKRLEYALNQLTAKGYNCQVASDGKRIVFERATGKQVVLFPYTGWWSGKGIGSGRGIGNLLKLL